MGLSFRFTRDEWIFSLVISSVHSCQHLFLRLVPPLIPLLVVDLESPLWQLGLLASIYLFAGGLFQAPMGILSDSIDRRLLLIAAVLMMSVGYLVFVAASLFGDGFPAATISGHAFSGTYLLMAVGMFVAGLGYSVVHPVGYPLISSNISESNRGKVLGMWGSASKLGDAAGPLLIGVLILVLSWELILVGLSLFGFAYAIGLYAIMGRFDTRPPNRKRDPEGDRDTDAGWRSNPTTFLYPVIVIVFFFFSVLFVGNGLQIFTPVFVSDVYGFTFTIGELEIRPESTANLYFSVMLLSGAVSTLVLGGLADSFDHRLLLVGLLAASAIGLLLLSLLTLTPLVLLFVFVILGCCIFGVNPVRDALITDITPPEYEGRTFGYIWTIALVGSSAYPSLIGYLGDTIGLQASFGLLAAGAVGGVVCVGLLYSPRIYDPTPN